MASALELFLMANLTGGNTPVGCDTDPTSYTVGNVTAMAAITKSWPMLPGTPVAGTVYMLATEFTGTSEESAQAFGVAINGAWTQFNPAVAANVFAANQVVAGWLQMIVRVLSPSTARFALMGGISETTQSVTTLSGSIAMSPLSQTLTISAGATIALGTLYGASSAGQGTATYGSHWLTIGAQA
jgi:hypothetical protein